MSDSSFRKKKGKVEIRHQGKGFQIKMKKCLENGDLLSKGFSTTGYFAMCLHVKIAPEFCACLNEGCTGLHVRLGLKPTCALLVEVGEARLLLVGPSGRGLDRSCQEGWVACQGQEVKDHAPSLNEGPVQWREDESETQSANWKFPEVF